MNEIEKLMEEREKIVRKLDELRNEATEKGINPYQDKFAKPEFLEMMGETQTAANAMLKKFFDYDLALSGPEHFSRDNVFVWGGPTPSWGGSMDKDASLKAKAFFDLDNVMYVYGPLNDEMLSLHKDCKKVICHLGRNCRTAGAEAVSDEQEAEELSRFSLKYPNIVGGVVDDMTGNYGTNYSHKQYLAMHDALHRHNPKLELYGVVYSWELEMTKEMLAVRDCIDHVILWFWRKMELPDLDYAVERCRMLFPGKPIMLGIFMFDYASAVLPNNADAMHYHLEKARRLLHAGKIQDIVILGDREIEKCPEAAEYIRMFLKREFAARP